MIYYQDSKTIRRHALRSFVQSYFMGVNDKKINYYSQTSIKNRNVVIISPGRAEYFYKYLHFFELLKKLDLDIFYIDHRGQGESERLNDSDLGHVEKFDHYIEDFKAFYQIVNDHKAYSKKLLFCHSMGSLIALLAQFNPIINFDLTFYSSPLIQLKSRFNYKIETSFIKGLNFLKLGKSKVPFLKTYKVSSFSQNYLTSIFTNYRTLEKFKLDFPDAMVGPPSISWVKEVVEATKYLSNNSIRFSKQSAIVFQSEIEQLVDNVQQDEFFSSFRKSKIYLFDKTKHELLWESNEVIQFIYSKMKEELFKIESCNNSLLRKVL